MSDFFPLPPGAAAHFHLTSDQSTLAPNILYAAGRARGCRLGILLLW
jgi:hypothetical protein